MACSEDRRLTRRGARAPRQRRRFFARNPSACLRSLLAFSPHFQSATLAMRRCVRDKPHLCARRLSSIVIVLVLALARARVQTRRAYVSKTRSHSARLDSLRAPSSQRLSSLLIALQTSERTRARAADASTRQPRLESQQQMAAAAQPALFASLRRCASAIFEMMADIAVAASSLDASVRRRARSLAHSSDRAVDDEWRRV